MISKLQEQAFQNWRILATDRRGNEFLVLLGRNHRELKENYAAAFAEVLTPDEQASVLRLSSQRWEGTADRGKWQTRLLLPVPSPVDGRPTELPLASTI